ncbi:MAG: Lipoate-protein ligase LplJ [Candidatus Scalindua rubra]|uniref:lipoate--protein ligase n=1 Tax=Candidatus Scalindua rubra TaxID=1872076 RepID=A0A1E3X841_9BACT|nr:MAG: Lipoate-protein ligase LplJ [Candidatus Scalindua rubra]
MKTITFYAPGVKRFETTEFAQENHFSFIPISITGTHCVLDCDHCKGQLLKHMKPASNPESLFQTCTDLANKNAKGVLISGGCDSGGKVPLGDYYEQIHNVKKKLGLKVVVHTGIVDDEMAKGLKYCNVDSALIDIIGHNQTIKDVYHTDVTIKDYDKSLYYLNKHVVPAVPHIVIGLDYGRLIGEYAALKMISKYKIKSLVLVILTSLMNTPMQDVVPPSIDDVEKVFSRAGDIMTESPIILGCARPMGEYKIKVDRLAVDYGFDGIAFSDGIVSYAREKEYKPIFTENMLWRYIENDSVSASFGLAVDEYLANTLIPDHPNYGHILRLYTYRDHCAILGRFQDAETEVNLSECERLGIEVNRRITGGGTIIMGCSQLGVAIIIPPGNTNGSRYSANSFFTKKVFEDYSRGIIGALSLLGIQSEFVLKNDILVGGKKIAGLAACVQENGNALFHASIILDIDTRLMTRVLRTPIEKISDKKNKEVDDRLTTINRESKEKITINRLKRYLKMSFENAFQMKLHDMPLTDYEITAIKALERKRYLTNKWIYQKSLIPSETTVIRRKTRAGMVNIHISVLNNIIKDVIITGDFFSTTRFISTLERKLKWKVIEREIISKVIKDVWLFCRDSISGLTPEILTDCILEVGNSPRNVTETSQENKRLKIEEFRN